LERRPLSDNTFEAVFSRPSGFEFMAGQRIRLIHGGLERDYSLAGAPDEAVLVLCIRLVAEGRFSPLLSATPVGTAFTFSGPHGYFVLKPSVRPPVFVATGTGVAPFAAMARAGIGASPSCMASDRPRKVIMLHCFAPRRDDTSSVCPMRFPLNRNVSRPCHRLSCVYIWEPDRLRLLPLRPRGNDPGCHLARGRSFSGLEDLH